MGSVLANRTLAQAQTASAAAASSAPRHLGLNAYSRYLLWLRTPEEIATALHEIALDHLMVTVGNGTSAHVSAENVTTDLPRFFNAMKAEGIQVAAVRGGNQTAVDADVERLVGTMAELGIPYYWLGETSYDWSQPVMPQIEAIKPKLESFETLNRKYGTKMIYHTRAGTRSIGCCVWDMLYAMLDFDPQYVGFHWDTGHMSQHGPMWEVLLRTAGPYVGTVSWKDRSWVQNLEGLTDQGGAFPGTEPPEAADEVEPGGRGRGAAPAGGGAPAARGQAPAARGGGPPGGFGGGSGDPLDRIPRPIAGDLFARGSGWRQEEVPLGTGVVDFFRYATVLGEMGFAGQMDLQAEYDLGGAGRGRTELTLPRRLVLGYLKRDVLTVRTVFDQSESGITV